MRPAPERIAAYCQAISRFVGTAIDCAVWGERWAAGVDRATQDMNFDPHATIRASQHRGGA